MTGRRGRPRRDLLEAAVEIVVAREIDPNVSARSLGRSLAIRPATVRKVFALLDDARRRVPYSPKGTDEAEGST